VAASSKGIFAAASTDQFASVDVALLPNPNYGGCAAATDRVRITVWDLSAGLLANSYVYIWFED
jgi:hypothetical protein